MQRFVQLSHHEMWQGTHTRSLRVMHGVLAERKGTMLGAKKIALNRNMHVQMIWGGEGDDDSGAGTFYFNICIGPSFKIDQCILVLGDEPQIICHKQRMQALSNISIHQKLVHCAQFYPAGVNVDSSLRLDSCKNTLKFVFLTWHLMTFPNFLKYSKSLNRCYKGWHTRLLRINLYFLKW